MTYRDEADALTDITGAQTLAAAGHAARHNEANSAIQALADAADTRVTVVAHGATAGTARRRTHRRAAARVGPWEPSDGDDRDSNATRRLQGRLRYSLGIDIGSWGPDNDGIDGHCGNDTAPSKAGKARAALEDQQGPRVTQGREARQDRRATVDHAVTTARTPT